MSSSIRRRMSLRALDQDAPSETPTSGQPDWRVCLTSVQTELAGVASNTMSEESNNAGDAGWMRVALDAAEQARAAGEVPVGAVVVRDGVVIATGFNQPIGTHDPSAHAEMVALRNAARAVGNYRLPECELYVTLEPCLMCAGVIMHSRISRVVYGAPDPKTGACGSVVDAFAELRLNHHATVLGGVLETECATQLKAFFADRRQAIRAAREASREAEGAQNVKPGAPLDVSPADAGDPDLGMPSGERR